MFDFLLCTTTVASVEMETCWSVEKAHLKGLDKFMWVFQGGSLTARQRNTFLTNFITKEGLPPYLIFLDSDIVFEPEDLHRIAQDLKAGYDLIGGDYAVKSAMQSSNYGFGGEIVSDGTILEIQFLSTGFMGMSKKLVVDMKDKLNLPLLHKGEWCEEYPFMENKYTVIDPPAKDGESAIFLSDDWDFCEKARKCGYKIYLDTSVRLAHKGSQLIRMSDVAANQKRWKEEGKTLEDFAKTY